MTKEDFRALGRFIMAIIALAAAMAFLLPTSAQVFLSLHPLSQIANRKGGLKAALSPEQLDGPMPRRRRGRSPELGHQAPRSRECHSRRGSSFVAFA
jgi:hypothetical protein